jgi:ribosomal-protein-alanine N-acetyltransferase
METPRLILRPWRTEDREPFFQLNSDAEVMEHFPKRLSREESDAVVDKIEKHFQDYGYGLWVVEEKATGDFTGFTGLWNVQYEAHFTPAVEVGWRLARRFWGKGYATEAARASLDYGFQTAKLKNIVAVTVPANFRSRRVMEKLGMIHDPQGDFDHPRIEDGHPLKRHLLYNLSAP